MARFPTSPLRRFAALALAAAALGAATAGPASADTPNLRGTIQGDAQAGPVTPAYDAPRRAGTCTGRKIG